MIHKITLPIPFEIGNVNVYLVESDCLTLIDAGVNTPLCLETFQVELRKLGYEMSDIEQVVLTHHHVDHVGLLDYFSDGTKVNGHSLIRPWLTQSSSFIENYQSEISHLSDEFGIPLSLREKGINLMRTLRFSCKRDITNEVHEGDEIDGLSGFKVLELPGHASTHIGLYHEKDGLLIGGDVLLNRISSNPIVEPKRIEEKERIRPLLQYNDSLRRLGELNIHEIIPGHGSSVFHVKELVEERLTKQHKRALKVLDMLKEQSLTVFEVSQRLFPTLYEKQLVLTISESLGQLDYLEYNDLIRVDRSVIPARYYVC